MSSRLLPKQSCTRLHHNRFAALFVFLIFAGTPRASAQDIPDTPKGFNQQYQAVFKAYKAGDQKTAQSLLDDFRIPSSWFAETYGPEKGADFDSQYADQHAYFKFITLRKFDDNAGKKGSVHTYLDKGMSAPKPAPAPPPASLIPLPKVQMFSTQATGMVTAIWMDSFIYVDGKFRFFGKGAYPFWDPTRVHLADPCAPKGAPPSGKVISIVDPIYPDEARQKGITGFVRLRVTVATDGSVKAADVISGNPLLVDAAKKAVLQWRYSPFMMCGKPVEMQSDEHVNFPPG
jgi:TonB family protein